MPLKIMPLGDSITEGDLFPGGYRIKLEDKLSDLDIDFVGSLSNGPSNLNDKNHEGHGGASITQIASSVNAWVNAQQPDIITLMIGTNDMFDPAAANTAASRLSALIDQITALSPNTNLLVASLPPFTQDKAALNERVLAFNSALPDIISSKSAQGKNVTLVDIYSKLRSTDIGKDGFHPDQTGNSKIAQAWESAIRSISPKTTPEATPIDFNLSDFNGDDQSDILWRNSATGNNTLWQMNGTNIAQDIAISPVADTNWRIGGTGDFNGDDQSDILWRNSATGNNTLWQMNGTNVAQDVAISSIADPNWSVGGTGDFNGDDQSDILWRNAATGDDTVWLMNGTNVVQDVAIDAVANLDWSIGGTGNFNGDGNTDILWRNAATGENVVWLMNGVTRTELITLDPVANLNWSIGGTGNFNGDNSTDIFWRNAATGENVVWLMNGVTRTGYIPISPVADLNWQIGS